MSLRNNYISFNLPSNFANKKKKICSVQFSSESSNYLARHVQDGSWKGSRRGWNTEAFVRSEEMTEKRWKHFNNCTVSGQKFTHGVGIFFFVGFLSGGFHLQADVGHVPALTSAHLDPSVPWWELEHWLDFEVTIRNEQTRGWFLPAEAPLVRRLTGGSERGPHILGPAACTDRSLIPPLTQWLNYPLGSHAPSSQFNCCSLTHFWCRVIDGESAKLMCAHVSHPHLIGVGACGSRRRSLIKLQFHCTPSCDVFPTVTLMNVASTSVEVTNVTRAVVHMQPKSHDFEWLLLQVILFRICEHYFGSLSIFFPFRNLQ